MNHSHKQYGLLKHLFTLCALLGLLILSGTPAIAATDKNPYLLVESVANATIGRIGKEQDKINADPNYLKTIVEQELMPYVDHRFASRYILHKVKTTKAQRKAFYAAFKHYLTTTYATVFSGFNQQTIEFQAAKEIPADSKRLMVNTKVIDPQKDPMPIDFKMRKSKKSGKWKAYDIRANGISLLDSKKAELRPLLRQKGGIEKVIALLHDKAAVDITKS